MSVNPLYDIQMRRRGGRSRRQRHPAHGHSLSSIATTACVAYSVYKIGTWAWNSYFDRKDDEDGFADGDDGSELLYEWTDDFRRGGVSRKISEEGASDGGEVNHDTDISEHRSRRARDDWSLANHRRRSHRASPALKGNSQAKEEPEERQNGDGMFKQGAKSVATGLGSAVGEGISRGIQSYKAKHDHGHSAERDRQIRLARCRIETTRAMVDFLPTLRKAVARETDVTEETNELKLLRSKKKALVSNEQSQAAGGDERSFADREFELWNEIKVKSVTRLLTTVYAHTLVFLVLTVQVNLLGGRLFREEQESQVSNTLPQDSPATDEYRNSHQIVLSRTYHYLFTAGIPLLAGSIRQKVQQVTSAHDVLRSDVRLKDTSYWIESIRNAIERRSAADLLSPLLKFVIPQEDSETEQTTNVDELANYILDETYDLLESPTFARAERQCLDVTFDQLQTKVLGKLFLLDDEMPLATVVTNFQKSAVATFHKPPSHKDEMKNWGGVLGMLDEPLPSVPNDYIPKLERLESVNELGGVCF
mmetsp:Transcript_30397/g.68093  ORF Transcript_30397/g.68093 Transcript_30397/m.68093 type:complete len:535 (-) Transcript_30397:70-1674(-)